MAKDILKLGELNAAMTSEERARMREHSKEAWKAGWQERIIDRLKLLGYESVSIFLEAHPGIPYTDIESAMGLPVAAIQIVHLQRAEARGLGAIRRAAMDMFPRCLNRALIQGWNIGDNIDFRRSISYATFINYSCGTGECEHQHLLDRVCDALTNLNPPAGWRPSGPEDPLIKEAFARGWPEGGKLDA